MARKRKIITIKPEPSPFRKALLHDRPLIIDFFKQYPNTIITSTDLMRFLPLQANSQSSVCVGIKLINRETDFRISSIIGHGFVYYKEQDNGE